MPAGATIIDVREDYEWEAGHVAGRAASCAQRAPGTLGSSVPKGEDLYVICHGGGRSNRAAEYMRENGYRQTILPEERLPGLRQTAHG